jgi:hypothetical protein
MPDEAPPPQEALKCALCINMVTDNGKLCAECIYRHYWKLYGIKDPLTQDELIVDVRRKEEDTHENRMKKLEDPEKRAEDSAPPPPETAPPQEALKCALCTKTVTDDDKLCAECIYGYFWKLHGTDALTQDELIVDVRRKQEDTHEMRMKKLEEALLHKRQACGACGHRLSEKCAEDSATPPPEKAPPPETAPPPAKEALKCALCTKMVTGDGKLCVVCIERHYWKLRGPVRHTQDEVIAIVRDESTAQLKRLGDDLQRRSDKLRRRECKVCTPTRPCSQCPENGTSREARAMVREVQDLQEKARHPTVLTVADIEKVVERKMREAAADKWKSSAAADQRFFEQGWHRK